MNNSHVFRTFLAMAAVMAAGPSLSDSIDLNLNDDAARLTVARLIFDEKVEIDAGWLHHQERGNLVSVSLARTGEAGGGRQPVTAALGARLYSADPDFGPGPAQGQDGFALGIGGFFRLQLAGFDRIGLAGHGYFAPDVLAFGDSEDLVEVGGRVSYSILREADIYLGIRYISVGFEGADASFDTGLHLGIRLEF